MCVVKLEGYLGILVLELIWYGTVTNQALQLIIHTALMWLISSGKGCPGDVLCIFYASSVLFASRQQDTDRSIQDMWQL